MKLMSSRAFASPLEAPRPSPSPHTRMRWFVYRATADGKSYFGVCAEMECAARERKGWPFLGPSGKMVVAELEVYTDLRAALRRELELTLHGLSSSLELTRGACYSFPDLLPSAVDEIGRLLEAGLDGPGPLPRRVRLHLAGACWTCEARWRPGHRCAEAARAAAAEAAEQEAAGGAAAAMRHNPARYPHGPFGVCWHDPSSSYMVRGLPLRPGSRPGAKRPVLNFRCRAAPDGRWTVTRVGRGGRDAARISTHDSEEAAAEAAKAAAVAAAIEARAAARGGYCWAWRPVREE